MWPPSKLKYTSEFQNQQVAQKTDFKVNLKNKPINSLLKIMPIIIHDFRLSSNYVTTSSVTDSTTSTTIKVVEVVQK